MEEPHLRLQSIRHKGMAVVLATSSNLLGWMAVEKKYYSGGGSMCSSGFT